jgi:pimeloyl-ACP methyl ester carboxylesterase
MSTSGAVRLARPGRDGAVRPGHHQPGTGSITESDSPAGAAWDGGRRAAAAAGSGRRRRSGFARPIDIPGALIEAALGMTHRALAGTARGSGGYLRQRSLPTRLAALGLPVLVIFGTEDARYSSSSAAAYRVVPGARVELLPGVGHTPMMEDPQATGTLLLEFATAAERET